MPRLDTNLKGAEREAYCRQRDEAAWQRISAAFTRKPEMKLEDSSTKHPHDWLLGGGHDPIRWAVRKR